MIVISWRMKENLQKLKLVIKVAKVCLFTSFLSSIENLYEHRFYLFFQLYLKIKKILKFLKK